MEAPYLGPSECNGECALPGMKPKEVCTPAKHRQAKAKGVPKPYTNRNNACVTTPPSNEGAVDPPRFCGKVTCAILGFALTPFQIVVEPTAENEHLYSELQIPIILRQASNACFCKAFVRMSAFWFSVSICSNVIQRSG